MTERERENGRVKKWFTAKGFGFIRRQNGEDLFVHVSQCGFLPLTAGAKVSFEVGENPRTKAPEAKSVSEVIV
jgi:CspA family cold shock protein